MMTSTPFLVFLNDASKTKIRKMIEKADLTIGRSKKCDFVIDDVEISRVHARVWNDQHRYFIEDKASLNGTFVNEIRLEVGEKYPLKKGDVISLGENVKLMFDD